MIQMWKTFATFPFFFAKSGKRIFPSNPFGACKFRKSEQTENGVGEH